MTPKTLVTGGTGFIGAALVKKLIGEGRDVTVLDNNSRGANRRLASVEGRYKFIEGDIRDAGAVKNATKGMESVIHLAFVNGTEFFYTKPELVLDVGVRGMLNVLDACREHHVPELVLASSSEVYQSPPVVPTDETVPLSIPDVLNARYSYGGGKLISELMAINWGRTGFKRVMIFRPHNVYGADMGWEHVIPQFVLRTVELMKQHPSGPLPFKIQGDGQESRAFIHIDDFVDGLMCVLKNGEHMNIYHIGNPDERKIAEVAKSVVACLGREAALIAGPPAPGGTKRRCPNIDKLKKLGFKPRISFDEGLPSVAKWYKDNLHLKP
jgi:dTDP-glucose 4,6-dehydratase/UDP-glucose 4-epimerase